MSVVYATFPGINQIVSVRAAKSLGIVPGVAHVEYLPQASPVSMDGTLVIGDGDNFISWQQAHLDTASIRMSTNGHICTARIYDRRFWWRNTFIHGRWNVRDLSGNLIGSTKKTNQELAAMLLTAMGESGFDVSSLPNSSDSWRFVDWDCANPAEELFDLCSSLGCGIDLSMATNTVRIVRFGTGASIPSGDIKSNNYGVDSEAVPNVLRICTGASEWQAKFRLRAVAKNPDGQLVPIDDADYAPASWTAEAPDNLLPGENETNKELANGSVYHLFQIDAFSDGTLNLPGTSVTLESITQCQWKDTLITQENNSVTGRYDFQQPILEGKFIIHSDDVSALENPTAHQKFGGNFQFYPATGIVMVSRETYLFDSGGWKPPELYLTAAFTLTDKDTNQVVRYGYDQSFGGVGIASVVRDDIVRQITGVYNSSDPTELLSVNDNKTAVDAACAAVVGEVANLYATMPSQTVIYRSVQPIDCDGITREVSWTVDCGDGGSKGAMTRVARNSETVIGATHHADQARRTALSQLSRSQRDQYRGKLEATWSA